MVIGRSDVRHTQRGPTARAGRYGVWGPGAKPIWAGGRCAAPTGRTHDRNRTHRQISISPLAPKGPSTHGTPTEQPGRELAPPDPTARAPDAAVQVSGAGAAVPIILRHDLRPLPSAAAPDDRRSVPPRPRQGLPGVAAGDMRANGGVNLTAVLPRDQARPEARPLTWGILLSRVPSSAHQGISGLSGQTASRVEPVSV